MAAAEVSSDKTRRFASTPPVLIAENAWARRESIRLMTALL
jgi:hypothetical protein